MMDCDISFEPFDDSDLSKKEKQLGNKKNSRIELVARIGKGVASIPVPILVSEAACTGLVTIF